MQRPDLDRELAVFNRTADRCAANLFELEQDPRWVLVRAASLQGTSAQQRSTVADLLPTLWSGLCELNDLLERANALRARKRRVAGAEVELERLLRRTVIDVTTGERQLHERDLVDSGRVHVAMTVTELVQRMTSGFAVIAEFVTRVAATWDAVVPRLQAMRVALDGCRCHEATADGSHEHALALSPQVEALGSSVAVDPLAVDWSSVDDLERAVTLHCRLAEEAYELRTGLDRRTRELSARITALCREASRTQELVDHAAARINAFHCLLPDVDAELLGARLEAARRVVAERSLLEVAADLASIETAARSTGERLAACRAAAASALRGRDDLRARLDAYRMMAAERGAIESTCFAAAYEAAHLELFRAPSDVPRAEALVGAARAAIDGNSQVCPWERL